VSGNFRTPSRRRASVFEARHIVADPQAPGLEEQDTGYALQPYQPAAGPYGDPNPFYGRVVYGPGLRLAQPLSVTRYDYRDNPNGASSLTWPRFSWQVYWNYQGVPAYGTLTTGAYAYPYQLAAGQSSCPPLGSTTAQRCVIVQWPALHAAYDQNRGALRYQSWHGSVLEAKRDRSGLDDHRQRVYDPQSGRFTQEDPIGLAGGLNLYGFANSDPVNFSDPFGLFADTTFADDRARQETQRCVAESRTCAELIGALARDPNIWTIATGAVFGDVLGETTYTWTAGRQIAGGQLTIESDPKKYANAARIMGAPATYRSVLVHEGGHAVGNLSIQRLSGSVAAGWSCGESCALGAENSYRLEVGLPLLRLIRE